MMAKLVPVFALIGALAYAGHWFIVNGLNNDIQELENQIAQVQLEKASYQSAANAAEQTIDSLRTQIKEQAESIVNLNTANQRISAQRDEYLSIFRRHDLYKLSAAKPGLIENRINSGTKSVFEQIEQDSREVSTNE